jgi:hypothetical protein
MVGICIGMGSTLGRVIDEEETRGDDRLNRTGGIRKRMGKFGRAGE